jgi:hypothetical protein
MEPMEPMKPMAPPQRWWPAELGEPNSAGGQNDWRYAYFAESRRLAVQHGGKMTLYDTGTHRIAGFAQQQQNTDRSATFTGQEGEVRLEDLKVVKR